ncbi:immunoglobulin domain-containing protein [Bacteroidota bacterium]
MKNRLNPQNLFKVLSLIFFLFTISNQVYSTSYYVRVGGVGGGSDTSLATALGSIDSAASLATAGDTVWVAPGIYYEQVTVDSTGLPGLPIWFLADTSGNVFNVAANDITIYGSPTDSIGFFIVSKSYITIDGFTFTNQQKEAILAGSVSAEASYIVIQNCTFLNWNVGNSDWRGAVTLYGVMGGYACSFNEVRNNIFVSSTNSRTGMFLRNENGSCDSNKISNNIFFNGAQNDTSIVLFDKTNGNMIFNNIFDSARIAIFLNDTCTGNIIYNNMIFNSMFGIYATSIYLPDSGAFNGTQIFHNTIKTDSNCISFEGCNFDGCEIANNILSISEPGAYCIYAKDNYHFNECNYNQFDTVPLNLGHYNGLDYASLTTWQTTAYHVVGGGDLNSQYGDPLFTNADDIHILPGSPCAGSGTEISLDSGYVINIDADIDGDPRAPVSPTIGADEIPIFNFSTYFVRNGGYGNGSGPDSANALYSIDSAASLAHAGDTIIVAAGTYNEAVTVDSTGKPGMPISFIADTGGVIFPGFIGPVTIDGGGTLDGFTLISKSNIIIEGFTFQNQINSSVRIISGTDSASFNSIQNCNFQFWNTNGDPFETAIGIVMSTTAACRNNEISSNYFQGSLNSTIGIFVRGYSQTDQCEYNRIFNNVFNDIDTSIILLRDNRYNEIFANEIDSSKIGVLLQDTNTYNTIFNNIINRSNLGIVANNSDLSNTQIFHNTIKTDSTALSFNSSDFTGCEILNNILSIELSGAYCINANDVYQFDSCDYNQYDTIQGNVGYYNGNPYNNLTAWRGASITPGANDVFSQEGDPLFISAFDLHLQSGSPCAGSGTPITAGSFGINIDYDFDGDPRDPSTPTIGADEIFVPNYSTYYVRIGGTGDGSGPAIVNALDSISSAVALANAGDTIIVAPGTYIDSIYMISPNIHFIADTSGIVFSMSPNDVIINGNGTYWYGFLIQGKSDIVIDGFTFEYQLGAGIKIESTADTASFNSVRNCKFSNWNQDFVSYGPALGIQRSGAGSVEYNEINNNTFTGSINSRVGVLLLGLDNTNQVEKIWIHNNYFYQVDTTILFYKDCRYSEISDNEIDSSEIAILFNDTCTSNKIYNNIINNSILGIVANNSDLANTQIFHNTIKTDSSALSFNSSDFTGCEILNNILSIELPGAYCINANDVYQFDSCDYNQYDTIQGKVGYYNGNPYNNLTAWQGASITPTSNDFFSQEGDPLFISNFDLHLQSGSPCAGSGTPITFSGFGIDIDFDIDGEARDSVNTTIGADEIPYTPITNLSGHISDTTLFGIVYVTDTIWIDNGITVNINPGTQIIVMDTSLTDTIPIIVHGTLNINGMPGDSVYFESYSGGCWAGIQFESDCADTSNIQFVNILGEASINNDVYGISIAQAALTIGNANFVGFNYGLKLDNSEAFIDNCEFYLEYGKGVYALNSDSSAIENCKFITPFIAIDSAVNIKIDSSITWTHNCFFKNSYGGTNASVIEFAGRSIDTINITNSVFIGTPVIEIADDNKALINIMNNTFDSVMSVLNNNSDTVYFVNNIIYYPQTSSTTDNQILANNSPSSVNESLIKFYNNTVYDASNTNSQYMLYAYDNSGIGATIDCKNSIIWGFTSDPIMDFGSLNDTIKVSFSNIEMYGGPGGSNLNTFPGFIDTIGYSLLELDFDLTDSSQCINAGDTSFTTDSLRINIDYDGNPRIYNVTIDMGAYEYQGFQGNNALKFNGIDQFVNLDTLGYFGSTMGDFTFECWVKTVDTTQQSSLIKVIDSTANDPVFAVELNRMIVDNVTLAQKGGRTLFYLRDQTGPRLAGDIDVNIYDGKWHHIAWLVNDPFLDDMEVLIDGDTTEFIKTVKQGPDLNTDWNCDIYLGAANDKNTDTIEYFEGVIDELRIWDYNRTKQQIDSTLHIELQGNEAGLLAYYNFNQASGSFLPDISPNNYGGTLQNMGDSCWVPSGAIIIPFIDSIYNVTDSSFSFNWDSIPGADKYLLDVAEDREFTTFVPPYNNDQVFSNWLDIFGLNPGYKYYFRVRAVIGLDTSDYSLDSMQTAMMIPGNGLKFNGTNQFVETVYDSLLNTPNFTFSCWAKTYALTGTNDIVIGNVITDALNQKGFMVMKNNSDYWYFLYGIESDWGNGAVSMDPVIENQWYHLAGTYDGTVFSLYVNGVLNDTVHNTNYVPNDSLPLSIGSVLTSNYFNGEIDEFALWDIALTENDIKDLIHTKLESYPSNMVMHFDFDQSQDTILYDLTSNGFDGTLRNMGDTSWIESFAIIQPITRKPTMVFDSSFVAIWDSIPTINSYHLDVSSDSTFVIKNVLDSMNVGNNTSWFVSGLMPDSLYYFRVTAIRSIDGKISEFSNVTEVKTLGTLGSFICGVDSIMDYDSNWYQTVPIGGQCWMAENLETTSYANGIPLVNGTDSTDITGNDTSKLWFAYNDNITYKDTFGLLYTWAAVMNENPSSNTNPSGVQGVCPDGWHVPSDSEYIQLEKYLGMSESEASIPSGWRGTNEGQQLKSGGASGFEILLSGWRHQTGVYDLINNQEFTWTTSELITNGYTRQFHYDSTNIGKITWEKEKGLSVRCLADSVVHYSHLEVYEDTIDFGSQPQNVDNDTIPFWIYNKGNDTLFIDSIAGIKPPFDDDFAAFVNIPGGDSVIFNVILNLDTTGTFDDTLEIFTIDEDTATVILLADITVANIPPVANVDGATLCQTDSTIIYVLANDSDGGDGGALSLISIVTTSSYGNAFIDGDSIKFVTTGGSGADYFEYNIFDGFDYDTGTVNITVNALPTPGLSEDINPACVGETVTFTATGGNTYEFLLNSVNVQGPGASDTYISSTLNDGDQIEVIAISVDGCIDTSAAIVMTINSLPTPGLSEDINPACAGEAVTLTAIGGVTYEFLLNSANIQGPGASDTYISTTLNDGDQVEVVVTDAGGCFDTSAAIVMTINLLPTPGLSEDINPACAGEAVTYTATGGITYEFLVNGGPVQGPGASDTYVSSILNDGDQVEVVVTDASGCFDTSSVIGMTVNDSVLITVQPIDDSGCEGDNTVFNVSATGLGLTYQWQYNDGGGFLNLSNGAHISGSGSTVSGVNTNMLIINNIAADDSGYYACEVSGTCGILLSDSAALAVNEITSITLQPSDTTLCEGGVTIFNISAVGSGLTYQWQRNAVNLTDGGSIVGSNTPSLTITNTIPADAGVYTCNVFGICGNVNSNPAVLAVNEPTIINTQPTDQTDCEGDDMFFTVVATGSNLTYQWLKDSVSMANGGNVTGVTTSTLAITGVTSGDAAGYSCEISGSCGIDTSDEATSTINEITSITLQPSDTTLCEGGVTIFNISAVGSGLTYQWQRNAVNLTDGGSIVGSTTPSLTITNTTTADAGFYTCVISGICGNVNSNSAALTVNDSTIIVTQPTDQARCEGDNVVFSVVANGSNLTYQWQKDAVNLTDGGSITGANTSTLSIVGLVLADAGNYHCIVTGSCNIESSDIAILTISENITITLQPNADTICEGGNAIFNVSATGSISTYQWQRNGVDIVDGGIYSGATTTTLNIIGANLADAGNYRCVITGCGSVASLSANLTIDETIIITNQPVSDTVCDGDNISFTVIASGSNLTYAWQKDGVAIPGETNASLIISPVVIGDIGLYNCVITNGCESQTSDSANLEVENPITINTHPSDTAICEGNSIDLSVLVTGSNIVYQWQKDGVNVTDIGSISGSKTNNIVFTGITISDAGNYTCDITNGCGTITSNNASLGVDESILITVQPSDQTGCEGDDISFTVVASGTNINYQWFKNGVIMPGETNPNLILTGITPADTTNYTCVASNICGADTSSAAILMLNESIIISTQPSDTSLCEGGDASFSINATGSNLTYQWNKDGVALADGANISGATTNNLTLANVTPIDAANYTCEVSGDCGNVISSVGILIVYPSYEFTDIISICDGGDYTLPGGGIVSSTGIYIDSLISISGCDSVHITDLTVTPAYEFTDIISICDGDDYTLPGGGIVSSTGIYIDSLTTLNGCDSVYITDLTVVTGYEFNDYINICEGENYTLPGGDIVNLTGIYTDSLLSTGGCDSVIITDLTVNQNYFIAIDTTICYGESYMGYTSNDIILDTLISVTGCDSIIETNLHVQAPPVVDAGEDVTIPAGGSTQLFVSGGIDYYWSPDSSLDTNYIPNPVASPDTTTKYFVTIFDEYNCWAEDSITVFVVDSSDGIQTIALSNGWNIISLNIQPPSIDMLDLVQPLIDNNTLIKVMDEKGQSIVNISNTWYNFINYFNASEGYLVKVNTIDSLLIYGLEIENAINIPLLNGWNIISYPKKIQHPGDDVLADLINNGTLEKVQNESGQSIEEIAPLGWIDNIGDFIPGEGYKVKVNQITAFTYGENMLKSSIVSNQYLDAEETYFNTVWSGNGLDHMNLYSKDIQINNIEIQLGDEIGVFDGKLCVGVVKFDNYVNGFIPIIVSKDDPTTEEIDGYTIGNPIIFKVWDESEQVEISNVEIIFNEDSPSEFTEFGTSIFSLKALLVPTVLDHDMIISTTLGDAYPNPFTNETVINYSLNKESEVVICIFNLLGEKVITIVDNTLPVGNYQFLWNRMDDKGIQAPAGIYLYRMETDGYTQTKQLIIQ